MRLFRYLLFSGAITLAPVAAPLAQTGSPQGGASLPDGRYTCSEFIGNALAIFGFVDIRGRTYRGPSHAPTGGFAPFSLDKDGVIRWGGPFGELDSGDAHVMESVVVAGHKPIFFVSYVGPGGNSERLDCVRE